MRKWILVLSLLVLPAAGCTDDKPQGGASPTVSGVPSLAASAAPSPSVQPSEAPAAVAASPKASATAAPAAHAVTSSAAMTPAQAKALIEGRAKKAVTALKSKNMAILKELAHPDAGIRFSPYSYIDAKEDLTFKADQLEKLFGDKSAYIWGSYDGSGEPIKLSFADLYSKFLYNHDYANPEKTGYNETFRKGNTVSNIRDIYPESIVVNYYFSGFDSKLEGMDWASLSLVFQKKGETWYLSGVVRDQWTI
jgi:hypothetical protein